MRKLGVAVAALLVVAPATDDRILDPGEAAAALPGDVQEPSPGSGTESRD